MPAWVIGSVCKKHDLEKAVEWLEKETVEKSLAMFSIGLISQEKGRIEEAAQWYKKAVGAYKFQKFPYDSLFEATQRYRINNTNSSDEESASGKVIQISQNSASSTDEDSLALYEELVGIPSSAVLRASSDPPASHNKPHAALAAVQLGEWYYTGHLGENGNKETAYWFYSLADAIHTETNIFLQVAETHQALWEKTKTAEDLKTTIEYYRLARIKGGRGFNQDRYDTKMAELNVLLGSQENPCQEVFGDAG